jgi:hypothetical protein
MSHTFQTSRPLRGPVLYTAEIILNPALVLVESRETRLIRPPTNTATPRLSSSLHPPQLRTAAGPSVLCQYRNVAQLSLPPLCLSRIPSLASPRTHSADVHCSQSHRVHLLLASSLRIRSPVVPSPAIPSPNHVKIKPRAS